MPRLFPIPGEPRPLTPAADPEFRKTTGIFPYQGINGLIEAKEIDAVGGIEADQVQPASLDLRLGPRAYRVQASFLPGPKCKVMDRVTQLDGFPAIDLTQDTVLEKGAVYVIELQENLQLTNGTEPLRAA
jgi:dCTP deaminase